MQLASRYLNKAPQEVVKRGQIWNDLKSGRTLTFNLHNNHLKLKSYPPHLLKYRKG